MMSTEKPDGWTGAWCVEHGHVALVDEDGCCLSCGQSAVGKGAEEALQARRELNDWRAFFRDMMAIESDYIVPEGAPNEHAHWPEAARHHYGNMTTRLLVVEAAAMHKEGAINRVIGKAALLGIVLGGVMVFFIMSFFVR